MEIHQFHPSFAYGDAIGNEIVEIQKLLRKWGYKSDIYCQYKDPNVPPSKIYKEYLKVSSPNNIIIIHYSIGYDQEILDFVKALPDKKFLIYHNITPSQFFISVNDQYEYYTRIGRDQLRSLSEIIDFAVGASEYSRQELVNLGFIKTGILPILIDFSIYNTDGSCIKNDCSNIILFVGRISPNKKQEDLIKIFYYYKKIDPGSKLYIVGSYKDLEKYYNLLTELIKKLELRDVYFTGKVSFEDLVSYYKSAKIFLCMSEHEGFCVPLIESMFFDIPIIAFNSSAIPYILGDSSILINKKNYIVIAELINIINKDKELKEMILKKQRERLNDFKKENIEKIFYNHLTNLIDTKK